ncbi:LPS export ABC transporter periplasmic protein LptC [Melioribacteraceae bacterium 4301-Me]|uniref:LPS export ABC transporter periplasmic protein LptC n=1 Tax=Pyranulibacter aquaticus TaxID=3163344 RepID=UPI00359552AD
MKKIIFLFVLITYSCGEKQIKPEFEVAPFTQKIPSQESWNSKVLFTDNGVLKAILYSNHLQIYEDQKITLLEGVKIDFYNSNGKKTTTLTSLRGKVDDITKNMFAIDSVVAVNDSGVVLKTSELMWRNKDQKILTDKFVTISSPKEIIKGYGFVSDQKLNDYVIKNITYISNVTVKENK